MCPEPLYEHNMPLIINSNDQTIIVSLDIENDSIFPDNTGIAIAIFYVSRRIPDQGLRLLEPSIQGRLYRFVILTAAQGLTELRQGPARNDSHEQYRTLQSL